MKTILKTSLFLLSIIFCSCIKDDIIDAPVFPPAAVTDFTAAPGNAHVTLNWTINAQEVITNYSLTYTPSDGEPIIIPNDQNSYVVNGLTNDTEYTFTIVAQEVSQITTQSSEPTTVKSTPFEADTSGPELASFTFLAASNPNMALETEDIVDLNPMINQDDNTVIFSATDVSAYIYRDMLIPTFEVPSGAMVTVDGVEQTSGVSSQNFTAPVQYDITENGITRTYIITVNKNQYATIPDDAFRAKLVEFGMPFNDENQLDITSTLVTEYNTTGKINLDTAGIANIKGIEFFVGTREIDAERNTFPSINTSRNVGLIGLVLGTNSELVSIVTSNTVQILYVNHLPKMDAAVIQPIIDANPGLLRLYAQGTPLGAITVENLTVMERLRLSESTAMASATSINALLALNPPIASDLGNLRIYADADGTQCGSYDPTTYMCN